MKIRFLKPAVQELKEAVNYYEGERAGLGDAFLKEIRLTLSKITHYPEAWPSISQRSRRCRIRRFPYSILYQIRSEMILVVAVMHHSRNPQTWKSRV